MMVSARRTWFAVAIVIAVVLHAHALVTPPGELWSLVVAAVAVGPLVGRVAGVAAAPTAFPVRLRTAAFVVAAPLVIAVSVPPIAPTCVAVALVAALALLFAPRTAAIPSRWSRLRARLTDGWMGSAGLAGVTGVIYAVAWGAEPFLQGFTFPLPLRALSGPVLGYEVTGHASGAALASASQETVVALGPRGGELLPCLLLLVVGLLLIVAPAQRSRLQATVWFAVYACLVLVFREVVVVLRAGRIVDGALLPNPVAWPWRYGLEWAVLPLLLALAPLPATVPAGSTLEWSNIGRRALAAAVLGGLLLGVAYGWCDRGDRKPGRVCFDDSHGDWEWMNVPLDRKLFGPKTTYNYWSFRILLEQYYPKVDVHSEGALTPSLLREYDVWVLKTPTRPFSDEEVAAVRDYVNDGGGVWLIGDHTNIFGMNSYLNQIGASFGLTFNTDALTPISGTDNRRDRWFHPASHVHPAVTSLPSFYWATSCGLTAHSPRVSAVMTADRVFSDAPDYSINTFFGDFTEQLNERSGRFLACAAVRSGRGRLLAFTDSTVFSSFFMHLPGKPELGIGSVEWLNRTNRGDSPPWVAGLVGLALVIASVVATSGSGRGAVAALVVLGACVGVRAADEATAPTELPAPHWTIPRIGFLLYDRDALPIESTVPHDEQSPSVFQTMFVWTQRDGFAPEVVWDWAAPAAEAGMVCLDPPTPDDAEARAIEAYLSHGGHVLVLSDSDAVLRRFLELAHASATITVRPTTAVRKRVEAAGVPGVRSVSWNVFDAVRVSTKESLPIGTTAWALHGAHPIVELSAGESVVASVDVGTGKLILCTSPETFSNRLMGGVTQIPTKERMTLYETLWEILDEWKQPSPKIGGAAR
jgi:hypothetical protein